MLLGFKVKNFRSFKELQRFSLVAGKTRSNTHHIKEINGKKYLRFSGIFGANGSGKSNLIMAIGLIKNVLQFGTTGLINNQYYRGNGPLHDKSTYFEFEIEINSKLYSYGFEMLISKGSIISEWLIDMTGKEEKKIFERNLSDFKYNSCYADNGTFKNCLEEMKSNTAQLFLSELYRRVFLSQNNDLEFNDIKDVYNFFIRDMVVINPRSHTVLNVDYFINQKKIVDILQSLDINITQFDKTSTDMRILQDKLPIVEYQNLMGILNNQKTITPNFSSTLRIGNDLYSIEANDEGMKLYSLEVRHSNTIEKFGTFEESDGTIRIFELLEVLLSENKTFIIDEVDSSLHPKLVIGFLEYFLKYNTKNQLIVTTHEMNTLDFDYIRRDEIWFTEKDINGASKLYSLEEFKKDARFDKKISKSYMDGRYGAIANIKV